MIFFNENSKLAEVIHYNHLLLPVINRLGVKLGFENQTIKEICNSKKLNLHFFIEIINVFHNEKYFPEKKLMNFSVLFVIDYLKETHKYYTEYIINENDRLIDLLLNDKKKVNPQNNIIHTFYKNYKAELVEHIKFEEENVFPYILDLEKALKDDKKKVSFIKKYKKFSISDFEKEHARIDEKVYDLKNIIIKYLPPDYNAYICNTLLSNLFLFENDLKSHARIEDKILTPKVRLMEKELL